MISLKDKGVVESCLLVGLLFDQLIITLILVQKLILSKSH